MSLLLNSGSGGATLATTQDANGHHQQVVGEFDKAGVVTKVSDSDPMPVVRTPRGAVVTIAGVDIAVKRVWKTFAVAQTKTIVALVSGKAIWLISALVTVDGLTTLQFKTNTTSIGPLLSLNAGGGFVLPVNHHGWFATNVGENLNIAIGSAVNTAIAINYIEV